MHDVIRPLPVHEYRRNIINRIKIAQDLAIKLDKKMLAKNAITYNQNRYEAKFEPGQLLWNYRRPAASTNADHTRRSTKFDLYATGPWRVIEALPNNNYLLRHIKTQSEDTFNVDSLVPVTVTEWTPPLESIFETGDEDEGDEADDTDDTDTNGADTDGDADDNETDVIDSDDDDDGLYDEEGREDAQSTHHSTFSKNGGYNRAGNITGPGNLKPVSVAQRALRATAERRSRAAAVRHGIQLLP